MANKTSSIPISENFSDTRAIDVSSKKGEIGVFEAPLQLCDAGKMIHSTKIEDIKELETSTTSNISTPVAVYPIPLDIQPMQNINKDSSDEVEKTITLEKSSGGENSLSLDPGDEKSDGKEQDIVSEECDEKLSSTESAKEGEEPINKFEPGDHVIRWKVLKLMLWPIQVHGIVLGVNKYDGGIIIADFGWTSSKAQNENANGKTNEDSVMKAWNTQQCEQDHQRFRILTLTDPKDIKKWNKVNYGESLFAKKGKFKKLSSWISKAPANIKKSFTAKSFNAKTIGEEEGKNGHIKDTEDCSVSFHHLESDKNIKESYSGSVADIKDTEAKKSSPDTSVCDYCDSSVQTEMTEDLAYSQMISQANDIEKRSRSRRLKDQDLEPKDLEILTSPWKNVDEMNDEKEKNKPNARQSLKFSFPKVRWPLKRSSSKGESDDMSIQSIDPPTLRTVDEKCEGEKMKIPKSDPAEIVLARVNFVLGQQDLPDKISSLPPYHIFYSNSECLAVWCKTGRFSTIQASVFLHSTAVGNAKSTFVFGSTVLATQPWLIPVVAGYGLVMVGMPYVYLKKCKKKWKESEHKLNDGFWADAKPEIFVKAIECWSGLFTKD